MKEYFVRELENFEKQIDEGNTSIEELENISNMKFASIKYHFSDKVKLLTEEEYKELIAKLELCNEKINKLKEEKSAEATVVAPANNVVDAENEKGNGSKLKKVASTLGAVALGGAAVAGIATLVSGCNAEKTEENTNENENENLTDLEKVSSSLSTFINSGLNNGIELTTDEGLMLMYASNIETRIDLGDNVTLDQVVLAHYMELAEDLIANNSEYKGKLVSDVAPELMTNDYQSGLAKVNDAFIKYGYIAPTNLLIANENDKKVLSNFEEALKEGIKNNGDFSRANELAVESYKENTSILSGTQIIIAGQYSAINAYGQNAGVEISGMDKETFDLIFRECGGSVVNKGYEAYTTYMTIVRSTLKVDILRQITEWNAYTATNENIEELAKQKYEEIDKFVKSNKIQLVTPENVNKERLEKMEEENKKAAESLNNRLDQGYELKEDSNGNQFLAKPVTEAQKEAAKKENEKTETKYDKDVTVDKEGNVHVGGENLGKPSVGKKPVPDAPVVTPDEAEKIEQEGKENAENQLKPENNVVKEEFIPLDKPIIVEEKTTTSIDGEVVSESTYSANKQKIEELRQMKEQVQGQSSNESVVTNDNVNPFEPEVSVDYVEGYDPITGELKDGYQFTSDGTIIKVTSEDGVKKR